MAAAARFEHQNALKRSMDSPIKQQQVPIEAGSKDLVDAGEDVVSPLKSPGMLLRQQSSDQGRQEGNHSSGRLVNIQDELLAEDMEAVEVRAGTAPRRKMD